MLYDGWLKFTIKYRQYGAVKGTILKVAIWWSLLEWRFIDWARRKNSKL